MNYPKPLQMNHPKKISRILLGLLFVMSTAGAFAQQAFRYQAKLQRAGADGFYRISLHPDLVARGKPDLADVRIIDKDHQFVPYIFGKQLIFKDHASFITFPFVQQFTDAATDTIFMVINRDRLTINQLFLRLRNTSVRRFINLSGSDDLSNWYAIKENIPLDEASSETKDGTYQQQLNFPASTYRYLKIYIPKMNKEPVAVLQAGIYQQQSLSPDYIKLRDGLIVQQDSAGSSRIVIKFNENYLVNKLHLDFNRQKYYRRHLRIYAIIGKTRGLATDTIISSSWQSDVFLSVKTNRIELEILNGDNPALKIRSVGAWQLDQSLVAYLRKGEPYYLIIGDKNAAAPDYDLKFFADSLQKDLKRIGHDQVTVNPLHKVLQVKHSKDKGIPFWLIWVAIIVVLCALSLLTFKMTREVNKRKQEL